ncbi:MAG: E3 ubiquitin protein ligase [Candidatus Helarchaeota archaeon]|nr:E3 ubiquitin protein ligase [Candidatus Helarchaeota archaeon]
MTTLEELSDIKRKRLQEENLALILLFLFIAFAYAGGALKEYFYIAYLVYISIVGGVILWLGYLRSLRCPNCLQKLEYRRDLNDTSSALFYCENCGYLELPPSPSQGAKQALPTSSYEKEKIIGICMVCDLPITEFEQQLKCPSCYSLAHETHLLEWAKIKGHCPHCNSSLKHIPIRDAIIVGREF